MQSACATLDIRDEADAVDAICAAKAKGDCCAIVGGGSKSGLGRYAPQAQALSTAALTGVTLYEPDELVLSARAGVPLSEIEALLDQHGQQLAFEPMDYGRLFGAEAGGATIGGVIAVNAAGPRRIKAGAARDHLLGFRCVTGRGELVKSGGRVMKNVTGYDLSKLVCGSYGTLALLTELTLKVLPKPRDRMHAAGDRRGRGGEPRAAAPRHRDALRAFGARNAAGRRALWRWTPMRPRYASRVPRFP